MRITSLLHPLKHSIAVAQGAQGAGLTYLRVPLGATDFSGSC
jgi:hypothetical protein